MGMVIGEEVLPHVLKKVRFGSLDEMYAAIGYGGTSAQKCANRVKEELVYLNRMQSEKAAGEKEADEPSPTQLQVESGVANQGNRKRSASGVIVEDMTDCLVKFAKCCTPVPGDDIIGFITRGYGVSVHRVDCPNAIASRCKPAEKDRWVSVYWDQSSQNTYKTALELTAKDRDELTLDVAMVLSSAKMRVLSLAANSLPDGFAKISVVLEVKSNADVRSVMNKLGQVSDIYQVSRVSG